MSAYEFKIAEMIHAKRYPFYSLIMAAMLHGSYSDGQRLRDEWPHIYHEVRRRLNEADPYAPYDKNQRRINE